ncbi:uncharacterized protein [Salmo salar]|uniref:Uncharacterized protein LOC106565584 n=1 Tax=Salmo salar TaxID=8030 RepID=A0A1S3LBK2_SALSA|nr:uncharacterized protein LOC106565584 [Salmo salar]XP_013988343.1 uncharacterized protein LOC106565584 [Salmo salar]|eukprot:XP_013988342.1 PREDICTED: uncharacterized protein LOC106565584 [Salmo salar]
MPRLVSDVWKHFTPAINDDGKTMYMCNYCTKQYVKNATKLQVHLTKCKNATLYQSAQEPLFCHTMEDHSQKNADECLARAIYATGSPLMLSENVYWKRCFNVICPGYSPPNRDALSTHLLEAEFNRVQGKVKETIEKADSVAVVSEGWSNVQGDGIINYIVSTPLPLVFKTTDKKDNTHTSTHIADELKAVINDVGPQKVFAVVTDSAANMKFAWAQVEEAYPHITPIGCMVHGLNLLIKDIMSLQTMETLYKTAKQVVQDVRSKEEVSVTYSNKNTKKNNSTLKLTCNIRWAGVVTMYSSLLKDKESLQEMARSQSVEIEISIRKILLDDVFWERVVRNLTLLSPITFAIDQIEGEDAVLSDVLRLFADLKDKISTALPSALLLNTEETAVVRFVELCGEFCIKPIHAAAYMLDPKHIGKQILSGEQINSAYYVISTLSHHLNLDEGKVLASLAKFSTKQGLWNGDGIWQSCQHISPYTWWKGLCASEALSPIASVILQIPPTAAASLRLRAFFGKTKTKVGNSLTNNRVEKLVAIRANLNLFEPGTELGSSTQLQSDTKEEMDIKSESE